MQYTITKYGPLLTRQYIYIYILWGQFLPRPSVAHVVIFGLESPTLEGKPSSSCHIRDQTSGTLSPLVIPYMA